MKKNGRPVVAIIQARMSSSRLPGKVLMPVMGKPLLGHMVERLHPSQRVDEIIVATSADSTDDAVARWCNSAGVRVARGSLDDVLGRYYHAALSVVPAPGTIVRLTGDCPLHHYAILDFAVEQFHQKDVDYFSNSFAPDFEDGFDVEVFTFVALEEAYRRATELCEREHVTPYIRRSPQFTRAFVKYRDGYRHKLSVDSLDDFAVVSAIFEALYPQDPLFSIDDVIRLLRENPTLVELNKESVISEMTRALNQ
jgi:spore coat polysaccharide biosynthesis protein SpsF